MNSEHPFFSIICPVFNSQKTIRTAVNSILNQDFNDWELIIINDGSDQPTSACLESIKNLDKRIVLINQTNKGPLAARLNGIGKASGLYILFLDSDDEYETSALTKLHDYIVNQSNNSDIIFFNALVEGGNGYTQKLFNSSSQKRIKSNLFDATVVNGETGWAWCKAIQKSSINLNAFDNIHDLDFKFVHHEDLFFLIVLLETLENFDVSFFNDGLYRYHFNNGYQRKAPSVDSIKSICFVIKYRLKIANSRKLNTKRLKKNCSELITLFLYSIISSNENDDRKKELVNILFQSSEIKEIYLHKRFPKKISLFKKRFYVNCWLRKNELN